jgi:hypothetical protein
MPLWRAEIPETSMRFILVAAAALFAVSATPAFAEGKQDFDLVNKTGYTTAYPFTSPCLDGAARGIGPTI